jgi:hypothetical protein
MRIPGGLPVEMGVHIDESRCHSYPVGVDGAAGGAVYATDFGNDPVDDRDIGGPCRRASAVHYGSAPNDQVVGHDSLLAGPA